jgi:dihydrofolate reductase
MFYTASMVSIIVAMTKNRMIGKDNDFPWHLSDDLKRFKKLTMGHTIIMGRNTYDHLLARIGRMLPGRTSVVVTRNPDFSTNDATVAHSIKEALRLSHADTEEVFVIGGAQLQSSMLPYADRLYLTQIDVELEGDAFFPEIDPTQWKEISHEPHAQDEKNDYPFSFVTLEKR